MQIIEIHPREHLLRGLLQECSTDLIRLPIDADSYYWRPFFLPVIPMDISETTPVFGFGFEGTPPRLLTWRRLSREERGFVISLSTRRVERFSPTATVGGPLLTDYLGFGAARGIKCS